MVSEKGCESERLVNREINPSDRDDVLFCLPPHRSLPFNYFLTWKNGKSFFSSSSLSKTHTSGIA